MNAVKRLLRWSHSVKIWREIIIKSTCRADVKENILKVYIIIGSGYVLFISDPPQRSAKRTVFKMKVILIVWIWQYEYDWASAWAHPPFQQTPSTPHTSHSCPFAHTVHSPRSRSRSLAFPKLILISQAIVMKLFSWKLRRRSHDPNWSPELERPPVKHALRSHMTLDDLEKPRKCRTPAAVFRKHLFLLISSGYFFVPFPNCGL